MVFSVERSYPPGTTMLLTWTGSTLGVAVSYLQDALRLRKEGLHVLSRRMHDRASFEIMQVVSEVVGCALILPQTQESKQYVGAILHQPKCTV